MDDFLLLWISLSLTFYSAVKSQCFPLSFHIPCLERKPTLMLFSMTATLFCQLLKKWNLQLLERTYQRRWVWPWVSLPKLLSCDLLSSKLFSWDDTELELPLLTIVKTGKLLAHMATAVFWEHYQAQDAAWPRCCLPIAFRDLHVFCGCSPNP